MTTTEPSAEALAISQSLPRERRRTQYGAQDREVALAIAAAYRRGIEDAARWLAPNFPGQARDLVRELAPPQEGS